MEEVEEDDAGGLVEGLMEEGVESGRIRSALWARRGRVERA